MRVEQVLDLVGSVRRSGRGWMAKCPAHQDRSPSLSIREETDRVLLHCFAGCDIHAICEALGITVPDLFRETLSYGKWVLLRQAAQERRRIERKRQMEQGRVIDACREAEAWLRACQGQDIVTWPESQLDQVMDTVGLALQLLRQEDSDYFYGHIGKTKTGVSGESQNKR